MEVVVFGAGSLGSLIGGLLARAHDVTLVGRDPHMTAVRESGLQVTGVEDFTGTLAAVTDGTGLSADLVVVTVKSFDTLAAARELATGDFDAVLSLQNGMGNEDVLSDHLTGEILAGSTTHGALLREPGVVEWTGRGEVILGAWRPPETVVVHQIADGFVDAEIDTRIVEDMRTQLWLKLAINAAINPVTALAQVENGAIRTGPAADLAQQAAGETAAVARAEGIDLTGSEVVDRTMAVAEATAENRSSMLEDVASGSRTEVDQINGYLVERAEAHGIDVPVNQVLASLVRTWEAGRGLR